MMRYSRFEKVCEQKNKYRFGRQYTFDENCQMVKKFYVRLINRNTARLITTMDGRLWAIKFDMSAKRRMVVAG